MARQSFAKTLTANDVGLSGNQAGVHIPKSQTDLMLMLPPLDTAIKNPDAWLECVDDAGRLWKLRYVYYNNSLHDPNGTRDEYRITHMTKFFRVNTAAPGDQLLLTGERGSNRLRISVLNATNASTGIRPEPIRLQGWRKVH